MAKQVVSSTGKPRTLAPVRPNAGLEVAYQRKLDRLIEDMHRSIVWWIRAQYRETPPVLAQDVPAADLRKEMESLGDRWLDRFDEAAPELANYFATAASRRVDGALAGILKRAGISVRFQMTAAARDVFQATVGEQVGLIKSIAQQHLTQVEGLVMRSVQTGRDVGGLVRELEEQFGVTRRRASLIARDQNNKATAVITRVRQQELGITQAKWVHSAGGRHPRPSHVKASREGLIYDVAKGAFIDGEFIRPGELINCRCVSRPIVPGFN